MPEFTYKVGSGSNNRMGIVQTSETWYENYDSEAIAKAKRLIKERAPSPDETLVQVLAHKDGSSFVIWWAEF